MRRFVLLSALTATLALTSCAAPMTVELGGDKSVDPAAWRTWAWAPGSLAAADRPGGIALIDPQIRTATTSVLAEKGLRPAALNSADAWVDYALDAQRIGRPDGSGGLDVATQGTLMIKMRDAKTDRIGWLGTASGFPKDIATLEDRQALATRVTKRLLDHFPKRR